VTAVSVRGLEALRRRLDARAVPRRVRNALRREADAVAKEAARDAPGGLAPTVEVRDMSRGDEIAFAVGTPERRARFIEHGTVRRPASPWLLPIFRARLPRVKQSLRNILVGSFKRARREV
jgi:hypothetical protein